MLRILFGFEGRIGRRNYWLAMICQMVIMGGVLFAFSAFFIALLGSMGLNLDPEAMKNAPPPKFSEAQAAMLGGVGIGAIIGIILICCFSTYMSLAAQIKRLHDMNQSGWLTLLNFAPIPISITLVMSDPNNGPIALFLNLIPFGLWLACAFFPGTTGPNAYGDDRISIFDVSARNDESWADRAAAHRNALRDAQVEQNEQAAAAEKPRVRNATRGPVTTRKGFGKRGMA